MSVLAAQELTEEFPRLEQLVPKCKEPACAWPQVDRVPQLCIHHTRALEFLDNFDHSFAGTRLDRIAGTDKRWRGVRTRALVAIARGHSVSSASMKTGLSLRAVRDIRSLYIKLTNFTCPCGRPRSHGGLCEWRRLRSKASRA